MKYRFENMKTLPQFGKFIFYVATGSLKFTITRVTTIKAMGNSPPEPFKVFEDINEKIGNA